MEEAAPQAARRTTDGEHAVDLAAASQALGALRLAWSNVYMFGHDEKGYWAARPDRPGTGILRADTPGELGNLLTGDSGPEPS